MKESVLEYIQGHAPATVGRRYGERKPKVQFREISKIPAINIEGTEKSARGSRQITPGDKAVRKSGSSSVPR